MKLASLLVVFTCVAFSACGKSLQETEQLIEISKSCDLNDSCIVVEGPCCPMAVNLEDAATVEAAVRDLKSRESIVCAAVLCPELTNPHCEAAVCVGN